MIGRTCTLEVREVYVGTVCVQQSSREVRIISRGQAPVALIHWLALPGQNPEHEPIPVLLCSNAITRRCRSERQARELWETIRANQAAGGKTIRERVEAHRGGRGVES